MTEPAPQAGLARVEPLQRPVPPRWCRLHELLAADPGREVRLTVAQLDSLVERGLPTAATANPGGWWTNNPKTAAARAWLNSGRVASWADVFDNPDRSAAIVVFTRAERDVLSVADLQRRRAATRRYFAGHAAGAAAGWPPLPAHARDGWSEEHSLYVLHLVNDGVFKVGLSRGDAARRIRDLSHGRHVVVVDVARCPNRFIASVAEVDVLDATEPWRTYGDPSHAAAGATEMWSDTGPDVALRAFIDDAIRGAQQRGADLLCR